MIQQRGLREEPIEVVTVNRAGTVIRREQQLATYFTEDLGNGVKLELEMVKIPGGSFTMGLPEGEEGGGSSSWEVPQHQVTIQPFYMGKYPITQAQWKAVANLPLVKDPSYFKGANRPVEQVSWRDAVEFCQQLAKYTGKQYRLPSEAEWEYACRAGTTTPFHFGETITTELANYDSSRTYGSGPKGKYRKETTEVGSFQVANAFGLYDMHGNVWEWCRDDWHDNYEGAPTDRSAWVDGNDDGYHPQRGGAWNSEPVNCRSADRNNLKKGLNNVGFRVVVSAAETK